MLVDLHMHSTESDGWLDPTRVAHSAAENGIRVMALSDHDCVRGVKRAWRAAHSLGMGFVLAVEITTYPLFQLRHILGHGVDITNRELLSIISQNQRVWRAQTLACLSVLRETGVADPELDALGQRSMVMPNVLVNHLLTRNVMSETQAWAYIRGGIESVPPRVYAAMPTPSQAVEAIHAAGGLAVGAHPGYVPDQDLMEEMLPLLDGLEVYTHRHSPQQIPHYDDLARRHRLPTSVGTDYHGYLGEPYQPPIWRAERPYLDRLGTSVLWPARWHIQGDQERQQAVSRPDKAAASRAAGREPEEA